MLDDLAILLPPVLAAEPPVDVALVLGSGLAGLADSIEAAHVVPYADIAGAPVPARQVPGHSGCLVIGELGGKRVAAFQGRVHCYQGFSAREASFPARLASAMGARVLVVTNASGGVSEGLSAGDLVLISDHINLACDNPLTGWPGPQGGTPFVPMRDAYDPELRDLALAAAAEAGVDLVAGGTYAWVRGPSFETPAEVAMLRGLGADIVGMSTVPEVIAARALGLRVLGLSLVTNAAAGAGLSHDEVLATGRLAEERMHRLALAILQRLP
ncbi:MAG TPA: purine-nucleoside phosphorylase [Coriobacteriia bacterium]